MFSLRSSVYATVVTISQQQHQINSDSCPRCDCPFLCTFWTPAAFRLAAAFVPLCLTAGASCKQEEISQQFITLLPTCQVCTNACPDYPKLFTISGYHHISKMRAATRTTKGCTLTTNSRQVLIIAGVSHCSDFTSSCRALASCSGMCLPH